jgi:hypothetical protein
MKILAYSYVVIMLLITSPLGLIICLVAANSTFDGDEEPRYWTLWESLILWPLKYIDK